MKVFLFGWILGWIFLVFITAAMPSSTFTSSCRPDVIQYELTAAGKQYRDLNIISLAGSFSELELGGLNANDLEYGSTRVGEHQYHLITNFLSKSKVPRFLSEINIPYPHAIMLGISYTCKDKTEVRILVGEFWTAMRDSDIFGETEHDIYWASREDIRKLLIALSLSRK